MAKRKKKVVTPTIEEILLKLQSAEQFWGLLHAEQEVDHTIFQGMQRVGVPEGYNVVNPSTGNAIINTAADHIAGDSPKVKVPEAGMSKAAQSRSEDLEHGLQDALWRAQSVSVENPIRSLVVTGLWSGQMISQGPLFDGTEWGMVPVESDYADVQKYDSDMSDYEDIKRTSWPFFWRAVDPRFVYPDPGTVGKEWVIVRSQRSAGSIKQQWKDWDMRLPGMGSADLPLQSGTMVQFIEYWDKTHRAYMVGSASAGGFTGTAAATGTGAGFGSGHFLDGPREHRYGKPQFQIRSCGYGEDTGLPHERFRSILFPARSLINQLVAALSQRDAIMRRAAWTVVLTPIGSGFDSIQPGTVKEMSVEGIQNTKSFSEIDATVLQALQAEIEDLKQMIQEVTFPNVVAGIKAKGIASGYGQNSLVAQAKVKYGAAVVNLSSLLSEWCVDFAHCVEYVVGEGVPIFGQTKWGLVDSTLRPDQIGDLKKVQVDVNPKLPTDTANDIAIGQVLLGLGAIDLDTFVTDYAHYEQPGEMRVRVLRDRALASPEIQRVLSLAAAMENGYIQYVLDAATKLGMDPGMLLSTLGFGAPQQQSGAMSQLGAGAPQNAGAQMQGAGQMPLPQQSLMGGNLKPQPQPGGQSDIRNQAVPGMAIR